MIDKTMNPLYYCHNFISMDLKYQFIVNPSAGHGNYKWVIHDIQKVLKRHNIHYDIVIPKYKGETTLLAKEATKNYDVIVAVGGDGTINGVVNGLVGTQSILGIIPVGTGNGFAREFGIPLNIKKACKILVEGELKMIDIGKAGEKFFLATAGLGFDALIAKFTGKMLGPFRGMWLYFFAGMLVFHRYNPPLVEIRIDTEEIEIKPFVVAIANTRLYGGRAIIAPNACPDDGFFDVCIVDRMKPRRILWNLPKLFKGTHTRLPEVKMYKSRNVLIQSFEPVPIHVDGEPLDSCYEMQFTVIPKALRILTPKKGGND